MFDLAGFRGHRLEKGCLYAGCAAKPPQDACQSKHQLALHRRFGVVVGNYRGFEGLVILCVLQRRNDGLGREAWRKALRRERSLPSGVVGPVLLSALRRLASICLRELIEDQSG